MKKTTFCCDRCGEEIPDIVYILTCYGEVVPGGKGHIEDYNAMLTHNQQQNMARAGDTDRHLCRKCKDEITDGVFVV